jgi:hypothetical protein
MITPAMWNITEHNDKADRKSQSKALASAREIACGIELFEQPVLPEAWLDFVRGTPRSGVLLCADESVKSAMQLMHLVREEAVDAVKAGTAEGSYLLGRLEEELAAVGPAALTTDQQEAVRKKRATGISLGLLAKEYGVSRAAIQRVQKRKEVSGRLPITM